MPTAVPSSFVEQDLDDLVEKLSTEEKISLLGAPSWWSTTPIPRLDIPAVRMSDGPNGVRGASHFLSTPSQCMPCATSLAATFDVDLVHEVGAFLAEETKLKSAVVLLAPTCNIQRNPLGGRAFESFSEDPHLSGLMAAAYVNGLQSNGVAATIKHFVANDQEHERTAADSVVSERALREIYLYPFMLAQKLAKPLAFMTSYGRIDDIHCAENPRLLDDILRKQWGFDGLVISDWYGTYSVAEALNAGLDLEMPGPPRWREPRLVTHMLSSRKLLPDVLTERAEAVVRFVRRLAKMSPDVVYGDGVERSREPDARIKAFGRRVAREGIVLLRNEGHVLPIETGKDKEQGVKKVAIIGPNAKGRVISGGGSAYLKATYVVSPWEGISAAAKERGIDVSYAVGCYAHKYLPTLEDRLTTPDGSEPGWLCTFYAPRSALLTRSSRSSRSSPSAFSSRAASLSKSRSRSRARTPRPVTPEVDIDETIPEEPPNNKSVVSFDASADRGSDEYYEEEEDPDEEIEIASYVLMDTRIKLNDFLPPELHGVSSWTIRLRGTFTPTSSGPFQFGLTVAGRAKLFINDELLVDNWTTQHPGDFFYGQGTVEEIGEMEVKEGEGLNVEVLYSNQSPEEGKGERDLSQPALMLGVRLGGADKIDPDQALKDAVELAKGSDVAVIVGGLTHEWESEGFDRPSLDLPGRQSELIRAVAKVNPRMVVVIQAGSAVDYSWSSDVSGILHSWYSGNEVGNAIADVLFGDVNPSGRMPLTFPEREIDIPAWYNTTSVNGKIHYREDLFVGYKHYLAYRKESIWAFGSGLSYTTFALSDLRIAKDVPALDSQTYTVTCSVSNTGSRSGRQVVQVYVTHPSTSNTPHVPLQLRGFVKTPELSPNESVDVSVKLDRHAFSFWDEPNEEWKIEKGAYVIRVGSSCEDLPLKGEVSFKKKVIWSGI